ncbi:MAG: GNAT family N-acetyltransferase, partial [Sandaracinobacteroides sp.]
RVRPATVADAEDWFAIRAQGAPGQPLMESVAEAVGRLAEIDSRASGQPGWRQWMVEDASGRSIGDLALRWPCLEAPAELGFELARAARGQGLATEAVGLLCDWALGPGGFPMLPSITQQANGPARRLLERLHFLPLFGGDLYEQLEVADHELLYLKRRGCE